MGIEAYAYFDLRFSQTRFDEERLMTSFSMAGESVEQIIPWALSSAPFQFRANLFRRSLDSFGMEISSQDLSQDEISGAKGASCSPDTYRQRPRMRRKLVSLWDQN